MDENLPEHIRKLIGENKLEEAFELLMETSVSEKAIVQLQRFNSNKDKIIKNVISLEASSQEESRITDALLEAVKELEEEPEIIPTKNRLPLILGAGGGLLLILALGFWMINQNTGKTSCEEERKTYTILVSNFVEENPTFATRVYTELNKNFPSDHPLVRITQTGRFIKLTDIVKPDTLEEIKTKKCIDKGVFLYGTYHETDDEKLFNGYLKLQGLSAPVGKVSGNEVILTSEANIKVPDKITFTISDQAKLVSNFITGLLKYYLGETDASIFFQKALESVNSETDEDEHLTDIRNIYTGNSYLLDNKPDLALIAYNGVKLNSSFKDEINWNKSIAYMQQRKFGKSVRGFGDYFASNGLDPKDTLAITKLKEIATETLSGQEKEDILTIIENIVPSTKIDSEESDPLPTPLPRDTTDSDDDGTNDDGTNDDRTNDDGTNDDGTNDDRTNDDENDPPIEQIPSKPKMIKISSGIFMMGNSEDTTKHTVTIQSFELGETEVTNNQFCIFLNKKGTHKGDKGLWLGLENSKIEKINNQYSPKSGYDNHPVVQVTWFGAIAYCKWLGNGYRLPSEAEWEYAAGGGANERTTWAGIDKKSQLKSYAVYRPSKTASVKSKKPTRNHLYDMSGNVSEWCQDKWHDTYTEAPADGSAWEDGDSSWRIIRGGRCSDNANHIKVTARHYGQPSNLLKNVGFRVAR